MVLYVQFCSMLKAAAVMCQLDTPGYIRVLIGTLIINAISGIVQLLPLNQCLCNSTRLTPSSFPIKIADIIIASKWACYS